MNCPDNIDSLKLVREGTSQTERAPAALQPSFVSVDERRLEHGLVFAKAYAAYLNYYGSDNRISGTWQPFFGSDVSVLLAGAAIEDVDVYRVAIQAYFQSLSSPPPGTNEVDLKKALGCLFSALVTLARQLDQFMLGLQDELPLKQTLKNLIETRLRRGLTSIMRYAKEDAGKRAWSGPNELVGSANPNLAILGGLTREFGAVVGDGFSRSWMDSPATDWKKYCDGLAQDKSVYGTSSDNQVRINHIATHYLFTSIFDEFLKVYARIVNDARRTLQDTLTNWNKHEPHYALFLSFLKMYEYARADINTLTGKHLDLYYRGILHLSEKPAQPQRVHLLVEPGKQIAEHEIPAGELFKAGKDATGKDVFFSNTRGLVVNQAKITSLKSVYYHKRPLNQKDDRIVFASPDAKSGDGLGGPLTSTDKSWHPFFNNVYKNGELNEIKMPVPDIGFAIASHYLFMAEGERTITLTISLAGPPILTPNHEYFVCAFTTEKGWLEKRFPNAKGVQMNGTSLSLTISIGGGDPATAPYDPKMHGSGFETNLPILKIRLDQSAPNAPYGILRDLKIVKISLDVSVVGLRSLALSNDFGPIDQSKPFLPFGGEALKGKGFFLGSSEVFSKKLTSLDTTLYWQADGDILQLNTRILHGGSWSDPPIAFVAMNIAVPITIGLDVTKITNPDTLDLTEFNLGGAYSAASRFGYVRYELDADAPKLVQFWNDMQTFLQHPWTARPSLPPKAPLISKVLLDYTAKQEISFLESTAETFNARMGRFYHLGPFGVAEQHPWLRHQTVKSTEIFLLPQVAGEAEFLIGITGLKPPQTLSILFQVVDGTSDPKALKPDSHIHWSYLYQNEWLPFALNDINDKTDGLLNPGIISFAIPRDATDTNSIHPAGFHWIRGVVDSTSEAVCRLIDVYPQALEVVFQDQGNDPAYAGTILPAGTISKLDQPDAAVKAITQPSATFGGRARETSKAFTTRLSERLRHKDRAITLWDYERLVLEAFPEIYRVKCLNHTEYRPNPSGSGTYRELAPGHVTIVGIPNRQYPNPMDPLRPYVSRGTLEQIKSFIVKHISCGVTLHVESPEFEFVKVDFNVRFRPGYDVSFYTTKLQNDITRFLSPWAYGGDVSPSFGGKIHKSTLIAFVEKQESVDYVSEFKLYRVVEDQLSTDLDEVEGTKAISILVSAPPDAHGVHEITSDAAMVESTSCGCEA